jgi:hypothetical protein
MPPSYFEALYSSKRSQGILRAPSSGERCRGSSLRFYESVDVYVASRREKFVNWNLHSHVSGGLTLTIDD